MSIFDPSPEHRLLRESVRGFVLKKVEPQALEHDRDEKFNLPLFQELGGMGLLGLTVDEGLGGSGMDAPAVCIVHEELSRSDPGFCLACLAHNVLFAHNINQNASFEQKKKWLSPFCSGKKIGAMAMSETEAGTDLLAMKTKAIAHKDGYILNGRKMWITNASIPHEKLAPSLGKGEGVGGGSTTPDGCLIYAVSPGSQKEKNQRVRLSAFFVERGRKGFSSGQIIKGKTGMRSSTTAELILDDCFLPSFHLIGKEGGAWPSMMKNLEIERLALAAMAVGIAGRALDEMNQYASSRKAFGKSIRSFGQIQRHLAESFAEFESCRTYLYHIASLMDLKKGGFRLPSDSVKLICSERAKAISDRAIQVLGASGYVNECVVERLWRDSKLLEIGGGTNEALQKNITKELGKV